jgi:hypothetical protein
MTMKARGPPLLLLLFKTRQRHIYRKRYSCKPPASQSNSIISFPHPMVLSFEPLNNGSTSLLPPCAVGGEEGQQLLPTMTDYRPYSVGFQQEEEDEEDEEEGDDDEGEGPPSLTAAFQSVENRPILKLCAAYLLMYLLISVIAFSFIFEKWTIVDSLYFAVSTFTTCGYGDLERKSTNA